jgi:hypothetical protein
MLHCITIYVAMHKNSDTTSCIEQRHTGPPTGHHNRGNAMKTDFDTTVKASIHNASHGLQKSVVRVEEVAVTAVDRVEDSFATMKVNMDQAKAFGSEIMSVVDNAGRTTLGGMVTMNKSMVDYGKDVFADAVDVSKKTMEARSVKDVVELQTAFAERRISAAFHTVAALNTLAQNNVMALWSPFATLVRDTSGAADTVAQPYAQHAAAAAESLIKSDMTSDMALGKRGRGRAKKAA